MENDNFIKNITSKDIKLSQNTILNLIKTSSAERFRDLCEGGDFIFPFLKERITNDFVKLINEEDLDTVFKFSEIYSYDFENLIVKSWLKFANEDLTDRILELFENGSQEQKAYCALYFKHINDPLALDFLNEFSYSDFEPLRINCAQALSVFGDYKTYEDMKNIILNSDDDFKKDSAYSFLCAFQGEDAVNFIVNNCFDSPFKVNIITNLLDFSGFEKLKNLNQDKIIQIFSTLIEGYPEYVSLDTIEYYRMLDFIKLINSFNTQYAKNSLIIAKEKFKEFSENNIYHYDLDKNTKNYLDEVYNTLKNINLDTINLNQELTKYNSHPYDLALNVIQELKLTDYSKQLAQNIENLNETYIAKTALVLKEINAQNLIPPTVLDKIQNENIKALVQNCIA